MSSLSHTPLLPDALAAREATARRIAEDYERLADAPYPGGLAAYVLEAYGIDLAARLGPIALAHPIGKASGQLSLHAGQVRADAEAGLAFSVLKSVVAEGPGGSSRMAAWKVEAARMECERITSRRGREGWTVSWIGRGWEGDLASYCAFVAEALAIGGELGMPVVPSAKLHLPALEDEPFDAEEYRHTLAAIASAWRAVGGGAPFVLEKDLSPTLAGSELARRKETILRWLREVPRLVREALPGVEIALGIKVMNALFEDEFQLAMLRALTEREDPPAFLTLFNRLFDPARPFGEHRGIAYGGWDLSDRNLAVLEAWARGEARAARPGPPISATGNIVEGRVLAEYALRGATSAQVHTFFQVPRSEYRSRLPRPHAALHELVFHPAHGLLAAIEHLRVLRGAPQNDFRFLDLPELGRELLRERAEDRQRHGRTGEDRRDPRA